MAQVNFIRDGKKRKKPFMHQRLIFKRFLIRLSILSNLGMGVYILYSHGYLTNIFEKLNPILEGLIQQLPL